MRGDTVGVATGVLKLGKIYKEIDCKSPYFILYYPEQVLIKLLCIQYSGNGDYFKSNWGLIYAKLSI